jgi:hypothetical protein
VLPRERTDLLELVDRHSIGPETVSLGDTVHQMKNPGPITS